MAKVAIGIAIAAIVPWVVVGWWLSRHRALIRGMLSSARALADLYRMLGYDDADTVTDHREDADGERSQTGR